MKKLLASLLALAVMAGSFAITASAEGELQNLCKGATVEVSGLETEGANTGDMAVDGDLTTRWSSDLNDDAWIIIDLGVPVPVGYLAITWETASAADYTIEVSSDGVSYTTVATVTGNTAGSSPASDEATVEHEWTASTNRFIKIHCTKRNTEWGNSIWEIVARSSKDAVETNTAGAYPSSGTEIPDGSVLINGDRLGIETGWGSNPATGRDAAFDGDTSTFFDPLGVGDGYCGIDAGEEMILTKILIHPRDGQLPRFNGATIEGANEEDFSDAVALYISVEDASEFTWYDVTDEIEDADNTGYRYFRYINYTIHGDVAEVELYGYAKDGSNPTYGAAAPVEEAPVEEAPVEVVETPVEETPAEVVETPVEEAPAEVVEAPAAEAPVAEAPQTFDFGVIAAVAAVVSLAGYAVAKKH
ncbi:MAG: discoidin domain-containing protein [Eubacteriales bacterium]